MSRPGPRDHLPPHFIHGPAPTPHQMPMNQMDPRQLASSGCPFPPSSRGYHPNHLPSGLIHQMPGIPPGVNPHMMGFPPPPSNYFMYAQGPPPPGSYQASAPQMGATPPPLLSPGTAYPLPPLPPSDAPPIQPPLPEGKPNIPPPPPPSLSAIDHEEKMKKFLQENEKALAAKAGSKARIGDTPRRRSRSPSSSSSRRSSPVSSSSRRSSARSRYARSRSRSRGRGSRSRSHSRRRSRSKTRIDRRKSRSRTRSPRRRLAVRRSPSPRRRRSRTRSPRRFNRRSPARRGSSRDRQRDRPLNQERNKPDAKKRDEGPSTDVAIKDLSVVLPEPESEEDEPIEDWIRSAPAELYYSSVPGSGEFKTTDRGKNLCSKFRKKLLIEAKEKRVEAEEVGKTQQSVNEDKQGAKHSCSSSKSHHHNSDSSSSSDSEDSDDGSSSSEEGEISSSRNSAAQKQLERSKLHPRRLHAELWHNEPGLMNDGPVCRCSAKARRVGIRHGFYPGETEFPACDLYSNNPGKLFHYKIIISPPTNLVLKTPTVINHDDHDYKFEGFSLFSHYKLDEKLPPCRVIRFNIRYCLMVEEEAFPQSFCVEELRLFETYVFREVLELVDLRFNDDENPETCSQFHLMPRFSRKLPNNGKELLSMCTVLQHLIDNDRPLIAKEDISKYAALTKSQWQDVADKHKNTVVVKRGMKPCAIRVDQIDRNVDSTEDNKDPFPVIVHFGIRPPQLSYAGNSEYQRAWRRFVKYRHLLSNMPKPKIEDKRKLVEKELKLQEMRTRSNMKRDVTVDISSEGFRSTGIGCDVVQHALLVPVLISHLRFHKSLEELEARMDYKFQNRYLLQLAMTHPSYRENFGTNPDHARNTLTNCGIRQPEYGDRSIHYASSRKRGINTLIDIMARFGMKYETESEITHNERLEFLGDAVVEFITSIHLFHIFPDLEEGGLATYRAAIVQNQHLAVLAGNLGLDNFMLYAHGSDLCHESELRHAMANSFEALMGALFLDNADVWEHVKLADRIFAHTMYGKEPDVLDIWVNYPKHPLQLEEPKGDRHWIESHVALQKLVEFEDATGCKFNHVRLLARAFTDRSLGYNNLTRGSNQRLEFLGDTVLQLIASEYLYRHFPDHHEGHLSLLRSSLVNNRTQATVCDSLGMTAYAMRLDPRAEFKIKDRADLLEAYLGAMYVDQGMETCVVFCSVCFFPRLEESILKQEWNDPKSKLQQCCLTLRALDGREPEIPSYKVTEVQGPTNTRVYKVAVYFKNRRLATSRGHSIQEAEMNAASKALVKQEDLFPQLKHQKRLLQKTNSKVSKVTEDCASSSFKDR